MLKVADPAPEFSLRSLDGNGCQFMAPDGKPRLLVFFETDCPTCRLTLPYISRLWQAIPAGAAEIIGVSQDSLESTLEFVRHLDIMFPVAIDSGLTVSQNYDPMAVPALFLVAPDGKILRTQTGFDKKDLNSLTTALSEYAGIEPLTVTDPYDGAPESKPGCSSRHLESRTGGPELAPVDVYGGRGARASRILLADDVDPFEYCFEHSFGDALPVIPPTVERVEKMLADVPHAPDEIIARIPPNYGAATVEKIAAHAVMAGCRPEMMRVLISLVRAACDERFNLHGVQATTHFAAPLTIVNGPIRRELGFACGSNVFSNVARANSGLGRAFQMILVNLGGARPGEIDMSTLGNSGKFSYCIAENEEESPWEPLHVERGFKPEQSTLTLFAAEPPRGVSEHNARDGRTVLKAISAALATVWTYRMCAGLEAIVVLCPEHVKTLSRDGFTKQAIKEFLFDITAVPVNAFVNDGGEGSQYIQLYSEVEINGEICYRKFGKPDAIKIIVAGGTAGKFSAVIGSWATGPRGSQIVTYPVESNAKV